MRLDISTVASRWRRLRSASEIIAWVVILSFLGWIAWSGAETSVALRNATSRSIRVAELRGSLAYLNEWLTMSARMAAATGDERWIERFDEASPKLQTVIEEALLISTPEVAAALVSTTEEAGRGLLEMQNAGFRMIRANDKVGAATLLEGTDYHYLEAVYQSGIEEFGQDLTAFAANRSDSISQRAWLEGVGFVLGLFLIAASIFAKFANARLSVALAETSAVARTDPLTGLPNRRKLFEKLQAFVSDHEPALGTFALLMLDVDRFKAVNDAHGHPAGDDLLQSIGERLRSAARPGDVVARIGGDEFAMIMPLTISAPHSEEHAAVQVVADRVLGKFAASFNLSCGVSVQVGTSIGVALYDNTIQTSDELVDRADMALYRAKTEGRNRYCIFDTSIGENARERALLEADLRNAIDHDTLVPYFQPLLDLQTGRLVAFEMLARWPVSDGTMVSPSKFIPIAESAGLIEALTENLMRRAFSAAALWPGHIVLACNVSPLLLKSHTFPKLLRALLLETGFPSERLELEITESALLEDLSTAGATMRELKTLGLSLSLDDFGTGYSSLRHLQSLPFDKLKIDAGFVSNMTDNAESRAIVVAVIGLGQNLGLATVAEGVESQQTATLLRQLGCDIGQGWFFGRPVPDDSASALVEQESRKISPELKSKSIQKKQLMDIR